MTDSTKKAYSAPVLHILPIENTMGKTFVKGGEGFFKTVAGSRTQIGNSGGTAGTLTATANGGGADKRINYDES